MKMYTMTRLSVIWKIFDLLVYFTMSIKEMGKWIGVRDKQIA